MLCCRLASTEARGRLTRPNNVRLISSLRRQPRPMKTAQTRQPRPTKTAQTRQPRPTKTARTRAPVSRTPPLLGFKPSMINDQLAIFARNLEVIDGTIGLTRNPPNIKSGQTKGKTAPSRRKTVPRKESQTQRTKRTIPKNGRTNARIAAAGRGSGTTTGSRMAPPTKSPATSSRLRIRARLRQISNTAPENIHSKVSAPSNINKRNNGGGNTNVGGGNTNVGGGKTSGRKRDMVAIDDIISLVNAIRGGKDPSLVTSQNKNNIVTPNIANNKNKAKNTITPSQQTKQSNKKTGSKNNKANISANEGNYFGNTLNMLQQMALMNGGDSGGLFGDILSNPALLRQISAAGSGSDNNIMQILTGSGVSESVKKERNELPKGNIDSNSNQSILRGLSGMKLTKTGNPVQDQMISSLMDQTLKHLREELQENIRKRLNDGDSPPSSKGKTSLEPK